MLSTDGVSKSFADEDAFRAVGQHYHSALRDGQFTAVLAQLPGWLADVSRRGSGDDATLCLVQWLPDPSEADALKEETHHVW